MGVNHEKTGNKVYGRTKNNRKNYLPEDPPWMVTNKAFCYKQKQIQKNNVIYNTWRNTKTVVKCTWINPKPMERN